MSNIEEIIGRISQKSGLSRAEIKKKIEEKQKEMFQCPKCQGDLVQTGRLPDFSNQFRLCLKCLFKTNSIFEKPIIQVIEPESASRRQDESISKSRTMPLTRADYREKLLTDAKKFAAAHFIAKELFGNPEVISKSDLEPLDKALNGVILTGQELVDRSPPFLLPNWIERRREIQVKFPVDSKEIKIENRSLRELHISLGACLNVLTVQISWILGLKFLDLRPLKRCSHIQRIDLNQNYDLVELLLTRFERLEVLKATHNFNLSNLDLRQFTAPNLRELVLHYNQIKKINLSSLSESHNLVTLDISNNQLQAIDLSPLSQCRNLQSLSLGSNSIHGIDLSPLSQCKNLRELSLYSNNLNKIDLTPLSKCKKIQNLNVASNNLQELDLMPLQNHPEVKFLSIYDNQLKEVDFSPLFSSSISYVNLHKINLDKEFGSKNKDRILHTKVPEEFSSDGILHSFTMKRLGEKSSTLDYLITSAYKEEILEYNKNLLRLSREFKEKLIAFFRRYCDQEITEMTPVELASLSPRYINSLPGPKYCEYEDAMKNFNQLTQLFKERQQVKEKEQLDAYVEEMVTWLQTQKTRRLTHNNIQLFLAEKALKVSPSSQRAFYLKVSDKLGELSNSDS